PDMSGPYLYYVMPLVTGETLRARLERERQLPVDTAVLIAREVADALAYAHGHGVIHRDIKPENILLQDGHALVADFGIALAVQSAGGARMTQTGLSLGTPQYMSPEQAMGEKSIDARSDIYALAAVTYEMLVGEPPFTGPSVQAIVARLITEEPRAIASQRKAVPEEVEAAVLRGLEKLPADRFATAAEFAASLHDGGGVRTLARTTSRRGTGSGTAQRRRGQLVAVVTLAACAAAAGWLLGRRGGDTVAPELVRFTIPAASSGRSNSLGFGNVAVSADGRTLTYVGVGADRRQQLMLRGLDDVVAHPILGSEDAGGPIFSPDGK
ncbi:MAG: serine/threonine-protein kinase, partial [Gemmatimonadales bacterium]